MFTKLTQSTSHCSARQMLKAVEDEQRQMYYTTVYYWMHYTTALMTVYSYVLTLFYNFRNVLIQWSY
jgi:hypothetical protein